MHFLIFPLQYFKLILLFSISNLHEYQIHSRNDLDHYLDQKGILHNLDPFSILTSKVMIVTQETLFVDDPISLLRNKILNLYPLLS